MAINFQSSYPEIQWDLNKRTLFKHYNGSVDDSANGYKLQIIQDTDLLTPSTEEVFFYFEKKDNTHGYIQATISGDYFIINLTNQVFAVEGNVSCNFQISSGGKWKTSPEFTIKVDDNNIADSIESSDDFIVFQNALNSLGDITEEVNETVETVNNLNTTITNAENTRNTNEIFRVSNEGTRITNEDIRLAKDATRPDYIYLTQVEYDALPLLEKEDINKMYEITDNDGLLPTELEALIADTEAAADAAWAAASASLPDVGTAGTYTKVTTDSKGRVSSGSNPVNIVDLGITNVYNKTEIDTQLADITDKKTLTDDILPFKTKIYQAKGQFHCHTTTSDGANSPTALLTLYKNAGYDFVAITDHDAINPSVDVAGIIHIRGCEYFNWLGTHMCVYGETIKLRPDIANTMIDVQKSINFAKRNGYLTSIAHPDMGALGLNSKEALALYDFGMMEIYTSYDDNTQISSYSDYADNLLKQGKQFNFTAVDDFHNGTDNNFNGGWIMVNTDVKDTSHILKEIRNGNYYSSSGNNIALTLINGVLTATSSNSSNFTFVTDKGRTTVSGVLTASYTISGDELYVRVEAQKVSDNTYAWSNPIFLNKKEIKIITVDMVKTSYIGSGTMINKAPATYVRGELAYVGTKASAGCIYEDNEFTITSGAGAGVAGLVLSSYNEKFAGRTIRFEYDLYRESGTGILSSYLYYGSGGIADITTGTGRVSYDKIGLYSPIGHYVHHEMVAIIPYGIKSILAQVKTSDDSTVFKVKNFKVLSFEVNNNSELIADINNLNNLLTRSGSIRGVAVFTANQGGGIISSMIPLINCTSKTITLTSLGAFNIADHSSLISNITINKCKDGFFMYSSNADVITAFAGKLADILFNVT